MRLGFDFLSQFENFFLLIDERILTDMTSKISIVIILL